MKNIENQIKNLMQKYVGGISDEQRKKIISYSYIILTLFTLSFFGLFAITPTLSTISNLNRQYADDKVVLDGLNLKLSNLQLLDAQYTQIQPDLPLIYEAIPQNTQIPQLTRQLENIGATSNVQVRKLSFGTVEIYPDIKNGLIYSYTFTIEVDAANQNDIYTFIGNIINFDRIIGIDRVVTGQSEEGRSTVQVTGRAFFATK